MILHVFIGDDGPWGGPYFGVNEDSSMGCSDEDGSELCWGESAAWQFPDEWCFVLPSWGDGADSSSFGGGYRRFSVSVPVAIADDDWC